jgi:preprotein translocase subunit SecG
VLIIIQIFHVIACITLILFILLQTGKGSDLGAMLGGGGANTLFGASGAASFLSKMTTYMAVVFMFTCLALAYLSSHPTTAMDGAVGSTIMEEQAPAVDPSDPDTADTDPEAAPAVDETAKPAEDAAKTKAVKTTENVPAVAPAAQPEGEKTE